MPKSARDWYIAGYCGKRVALARVAEIGIWIPWCIRHLVLDLEYADHVSLDGLFAGVRVARGDG